MAEAVVTIQDVAVASSVATIAAHLLSFFFSFSATAAITLVSLTQDVAVTMVVDMTETEIEIMTAIAVVVANYNQTPSIISLGRKYPAQHDFIFKT